MTLFANSGVAWPKHEQQTRDAGGKSLEAASTLFRVLASIESRSEHVSPFDLTSCSQALDHAAVTYASIADDLSSESVPALTPAEIELASIPVHRRYYDEPFSELFMGRPRISLRELYLELSQRSARLASAVRMLNPDLDPVDLAPAAFQIMQLWETMAVLGRVIATLGRRPMRRG